VIVCAEGCCVAIRRSVETLSKKECYNLLLRRCALAACKLTDRAAQLIVNDKAVGLMV